MPKKIKVTQSRSETSAASTSSLSDTEIDKVKPRRTSTSNKAGKPTSKKSASARKARSAKAAAPASIAEPADEEIRLRAYFISERRRRFALPGDASSDWLEAKRQLLSDAGPR